MDTNHLQEAKNWTERATISESGDQGSMADIGKNHALIYIAEQLEIMNHNESKRWDREVTTIPGFDRYIKPKFCSDCKDPDCDGSCIPF